MEWRQRFLAAAGYLGYTAATSTAAIERAAAAATSRVTELSRNGAWADISSRLDALRPAGIEYVGFQNAGLLSAREEGFHVLCLRVPPQVSVATEQAFVNSFSPWLEALDRALPQFQLTDEAQTAVKGMVAAATGVDPLLAAGLAAVLQLAQGNGKVKCLSVVPVARAEPALVAQWQQTDLVSEPLLGPWIMEWLWDVQSNAVYASGHSALERTDQNLIGRPERLRDALTVVG